MRINNILLNVSKENKIGYTYIHNFLKELIISIKEERIRTITYDFNSEKKLGTLLKKKL